MDAETLKPAKVLFFPSMACTVMCYGDSQDPSRLCRGLKDWAAIVSPPRSQSCTVREMDDRRSCPVGRGFPVRVACLVAEGLAEKEREKRI